MVTSTKANRSHTPRKPATSNFARKAVKPNASILSFFKKTEKPEDSLFVGATIEAEVTSTTTPDDDLYDANDVKRFNEVESPNKRRKLSPEPEHSTIKEVTITVEEIIIKTEDQDGRRKNSKPKLKGPFVMDSDSEDEDEVEKTDETNPIIKEKADQCANTPPRIDGHQLDHTKDEEKDKFVTPPRIKQEDSTDAQLDDAADYDDLGAFDTDEIEGEELRAMRYMREQARLEAEEAGSFSYEDLADDPLDDDSMVENCPICDGSLAGISADEATRHVNACLDGNPIPLPKKEVPTPEKDVETIDTPSKVSEVKVAEIGKRFARAAVPRPGQAIPFELGDKSSKGSKSAFSALMSNNTEDSAWATAAAAENASRGKQAYERTCPFYKIMPGFYICVDAFRYGAVQGCKAYFLSHFHSDHYIGLTSSWRHGPIYCSKVTGSLVRNQLRTAAKWVVELEFDKSYDIPGTEGATVTMIPANHCPGSSLFLFEKTMNKDRPNSRVQRILHCGDFRACPAHIAHPLLKPDVVDSISGKTRHQKIDICYLDTTYLNPRYSFPPQDDVIQACADLIASMSPDPNCKNDVWERSAQALGTPAVSKFFKSIDAENEKEGDVKKGRPQRLLVICGTYSIGKERVCIAIAKALKSKIFATPGKIKICKQLQDPELAALMTSNPREAQVHMQMLMEIRAETLQDYLNGYKPHFSRIVGFRPSGWNFRPPNSKAVGANTAPGSIPTQQVLHGKGWRTRFGYRDFVAQRGSTKEAMCFGVPYSEHSSFRELSMFVMGLRIEKIIPTVNVGSEQSRKRMKAWIDRWTAERRKGGLVVPLIEGKDEDVDDDQLWDGKSGKGGGAWW